MGVFFGAITNALVFPLRERHNVHRSQILTEGNEPDKCLFEHPLYGATTTERKLNQLKDFFNVACLKESLFIFAWAS